MVAVVALERAATKVVIRFIYAAFSFLSARISVIMSSDKMVLVVVALAAISLSTAVASPITDCSSSIWYSNAAEYSDRASYLCMYCVGAVVGDSVLQEKGCSHRELVL